MYKNKIEEIYKKIKFLILAVCTLLFAYCNNPHKSNVIVLDKSISKIEVLDFHSTHRCITCNAIEANTKYTLNTYFTTELQENKITFRVINVDKKENEEIAEKFKASGTALILNVIKKGKETPINLTDFAFMNGNNKKEFSEKLKNTIHIALKTL
ncbi:nitrophenyl compound nitroreductase subunit ArsF family protein [Tenacibaculum aestuariivivum]|uniref:nitrophenyl compound nitroreductase subunit ArsF family protein n=1 Tax=Tenacibaculum aestuariivivum TaxID=2006131 RepID=UPI003AB6FA85